MERAGARVTILTRSKANDRPSKDSGLKADESDESVVEVRPRHPLSHRAKHARPGKDQACGRECDVEEVVAGRLDSKFTRNVFINCPFDAEYAPIFEAIVFAVHDAGFRAKCARERLDSSEVRFQKIVALIGASRYSIHDLSRTALDHTTSLPRFNMPLELGIDLGCKSFSTAHHGNLTFVDFAYTIAYWLRHA